MARVKISTEDILSSIFTLRGQRVILAADRASLYGVETKRLNEQVRRNQERFPRDFVFELTREELVETSRSQSATLKQGHNLKDRPMAFTQRGVHPRKKIGFHAAIT